MRVPEHKRVAFAVVALAGMLLPVLLSGCHRTPRIPVQENAADQFSLALRQHQIYSRTPTEDMDKAARVTLAAYRQVLESYPDESLYVNRARLGIASIYYDQEKYRQAFNIYTDLLKDAPDDDLLQAQSLYHMGQIYDMRGDFVEAQDAYKKVIERYAQSPVPQIQRLYKQSQMAYQRIRMP